MTLFIGPHWLQLGVRRCVLFQVACTMLLPSCVERIGTRMPAAQLGFQAGRICVHVRVHARAHVCAWHPTDITMTLAYVTLPYVTIPYVTFRMYPYLTLCNLALLYLASNRGLARAVQVPQGSAQPAPEPPASPPQAPERRGLAEGFLVQGLLRSQGELKLKSKRVNRQPDLRASSCRGYYAAKVRQRRYHGRQAGSCTGGHCTALHAPHPRMLHSWSPHHVGHCALATTCGSE